MPEVEALNQEPIFTSQKEKAREMIPGLFVKESPTYGLGRDPPCWLV